MEDVFMKKLYCQLAVGLCLSMMVPLCGKVFAQSADINIKVTTPTPPPRPPQPNPCSKYEEGKQASESIHLYYLRSAPTIKEILTKFTEANACLKGTSIEAQDNNIIVLYGHEEQRKELEQIIAILDLPREGVRLEMWGILISSDNPRQLAEVLRRVNQEIDQTQQLLQETYRKLEASAREITIEENFSDLFENDLGFRAALDKDRPSLSMTDILLRMNVAEKPLENYQTAVKKICGLFFEKNNQKQYQDYIEALKKKKKIPFENFFRYYGFQPNPDLNLSPENCFVLQKPEGEVLKDNFRRRKAILDFALQYSRLANDPGGFEPQSLQQSAESLNSIFNPVVNLINRDVEELFIEPTLEKIQSIVREYKNVEYAEVGKTSIAGLNGVPSTVTSTSVSAFDETGPLRLNEWLQEAGQLNSSAQDLLPSETVNFGAKTIPVASVVSLISALSKDRSLWRGLTSGISLDITPFVLRNNASAQLDVTFIIGPQGDGKEPDEHGKLRPLSRINQNTVETSVYVNTLDIFALSTFNSQTTIDGGRSYIPIIGTVWKGIFSGIPILGDLFSWHNAPKNVQHQSIVLTNSFIVPTAMGLAPLYQPPSNPTDSSADDYYSRCSKVKTYKSWLQIELKPEDEREQSSQEYTYAANPQSFLDNNKLQAICGNPPQVYP